MGVSAAAELAWRVLPDVRPRERRRFLFFAGLSTLIGLAQTLGFVGAEAIFLARLGAAELPRTFVAASLATVLGSLLYGLAVGRQRNDSLFAQMLLGSGLLLLAASAATAAGLPGILPLPYGFFYLTQAIFLNHFWTFASDYFDTPSCKRLFPLFTVGASLGGAAGGGLALLATRFAGSASLLAGWGVGLAAAALLLRLGRRSLRRWGPLEVEELDETSVAGLGTALRYLRGSPLGRWLAASALTMVLALFVAQYLYSGIFAESFPSEADLAAFFGIYLLATNAVEIAIELALTPWLIRRFGVPSANLVHPLLTLASFAGLAARPALAAAVLARVNRELFENALAGPVRSLVYNALPLRLRGRSRAFLEGIVVYGGMSLAGLLLLGLGDPDPIWLCAAGGAASLVYCVANLRVRRQYLEALLEGIRAGRLDLDEVGGEIGGFEATRLASAWEQLLEEERQRPSRSLLELIPRLAERGVTAPLLRATLHPSPEVRATCLLALARSDPGPFETSFAHALGDPEPAVRRAALRALRELPEPARTRALRTRDLLADPEPGVRAEAALLAGAAGAALLEKMIRSPRAAEATAALAVADGALAEAALARLARGEPAVRAAALAFLAREAPGAAVPPEQLEAARGDPEARVRAPAVALLERCPGEAALAALAEALFDPAREVRSAAAQALAARGDEGVAAARWALEADREGAVEAALRVVAEGAGRRAQGILYGELRRRVRALWSSLLAREGLPEEATLAARFLRAALADDVERNRRLAFRILELAEDEKVIARVERALRFGSSRTRGDALEVLSNLGDREAAELLVLLHDAGPLEDRAGQARRFLRAPQHPEEIALAAHRSEVRWIRLGAAAAPPGSAPQEEEDVMERLLALKRVPLFSQLSLEQLDAVDRIAREASYLAGEVIVREGNPGHELFLLLEGEVRVIKGLGTPGETLLSTLAAVSYFGEMAILDANPRSASVVAAAPARLLSLEGRSLEELILQRPEISFEILRVLTARVRAAERRLEEGR